MFEQLFNYNLLINTFGVLLCLIILETILSADNAVALASLVKHLPEAKHQKRALNFGLGGAFILRIFLIIMSTWVIQFWQFQLAGSLYLLWLTFKYFWIRIMGLEETEAESIFENAQSGFAWQIIPSIAMTDLAFSLDSVTTAIALSNQIWLIIVGGLIGVIALRFLAELFISWLNHFTYLQDAAYLTIFWVGIRLLLKALLPGFILPEWLILSVIVILFTWGFSKKSDFQVS
jgi:YkoY family integral membrane protein